MVTTSAQPWLLRVRKHFRRRSRPLLEFFRSHFGSSSVSQVGLRQSQLWSHFGPGMSTQTMAHTSSDDEPLLPLGEENATCEADASNPDTSTGADDQEEAGGKAQHAGLGARERKIRNADHSLGDYDRIADFPPMSSEEMDDVPHLLKTFHMWRVPSVGATERTQNAP